MAGFEPTPPLTVHIVLGMQRLAAGAIGEEVFGRGKR